MTDYFGLIVSSIAETLDLHGRPVVLNAGEAAQNTPVLSTLPTRAGIAGAIIVLPPEPGTDLVALQSAGFPFVVVDPRERPADGIPCVSAMHASGAKQAVEHLLGLGHRRIGAIAGNEGWYATEERLLGFRAAMAGAGILPDPSLIHYSNFQVPEGERAHATANRELST